MFRNVKELYQSRALLYALTGRELKARYRGSALGFLWTFLNPTMLMGVYALVFGKFLKNSMPHYPYFMFVGLLPWIWFTSSVGGGASTISERRDLLTKVSFPAQVLPTTVVTTNLINYLLSLPLMVALGLAFDVRPTWHALFFPAIAAAQLLFTLALTLLISSLNVAFRDLQHIVNNLLTLWFFATPVVYSADAIPDVWWRRYFLLGNPMTVIIRAYQAIFYQHQVPNLAALGCIFLGSLFLMWLASSVFESRREEFAEII